MIVSFVLTGMVPYTQLDVSDPVAFALHFRWRGYNCRTTRC